jgi:two-component system NtrC family sensor kinase
VLLNNDNRLVDRITRVVFQRSQTDRSPPGNATIFLDEVRIATSVLDERGKPAIGSLMSVAVFDTISRGMKSIGRAFVLRDHYFTAYEPLFDLNGSVAGALYVGMPEQPLMQLRSQVNIIFTWVLLLVTLIGIALSAWLGKSMTRPVRALVEGVRRIAAGENLPDIHVDSHDEIHELADEFNTMKHRLATREEENSFLNRTLEQRVVMRTAQLEEKNQQLMAAQKELAEAERLAAVGMLASGVAHEINNPLAIVRGNAELLEMMIEAETPGSEEVETILRQAGRIEHIVRNLLTFSRNGIKRVSRFSLETLLNSILDQVGHQIPLEDYAIARDYLGKEIVLEGDEDQLRQVFTNLVVNGLQAMAVRGILTVDAALDGNGTQVSVTVADNGPGISLENREKLFTPFFSTKSGGTGLGLAISYGIVKDHGGEIRVASETGEGASFVVTLPVRQPEEKE